MSRSRALAALTFVAAVCATGARAGTATANLAVSATVQDACSVSDTTLGFGSVTPSAGTSAVSGSISVTCTLGTAFSVGLANGANWSGTIRRMRQGVSSNYLNYEIYKDVATTTRFGDTGASDRATGTGTGVTSVPISFYGKVPSGQTGAAGGYSDTVQITIYY